MSMVFNSPPRGEIYAPLNMRPPQRAEGNIRYLQFIRLVKKLWEETHPDIPIKATQSHTFTHYPVITYGLQLRRTTQGEPKPKRREEIIDKNGELYIISGQRFENVIIFTVITQENPELAEEIIEAFEDFMLEQTPVFKELGVSEFVYARRLPDSEQTRVNEDVETRAVSYLMTEERIRQIRVERLKDIVVNARLFLEQQPTNFSVAEGSDFLALDNTTEDVYNVGEPVAVYSGPLGTAPLPPGLHHGWKYVISEIDGSSIKLNTISGEAVSPQGAGVGRIVPDKVILMTANIEDLYASSTPRTD